MAYWALRISLTMLSWLPWRVLYVLSDLSFVLLYHIIGYRRALVRSNLSHAFPDLSLEKRTAIERKFYHNLCDMMVETIKMFSTDVEQIKARFTVIDAPYQRWYAANKSVLQASGHFFNWEWANWLLKHQTPYQVHILYMIMGSSAFERAMSHIRARVGSKLVPANDLRTMMTEPEQPTVTVFLADQNPSELRRAYWTTFMGRQVPFHRGLEIMARRTGQMVVFEDMERLGRGRYHNHTHLAFTDASGTSDGEVTEAYVRWLEERVKAHPENWLWTHNRWKHTAKHGKLGQ